MWLFQIGFFHLAICLCLFMAKYFLLLLNNSALYGNITVYLSTHLLNATSSGKISVMSQGRPLPLNSNAPCPSLHIVLLYCVALLPCLPLLETRSSLRTEATASSFPYHCPAQGLRWRMESENVCWVNE